MPAVSVMSFGHLYSYIYLGFETGIMNEFRALQWRGATKAQLLLLDNVEQVIEGVVDLLATVRRAAPSARWLVTSRQPLGVAGEWLHEVHPLATVRDGDGDDPDAVRLLVERVQRGRLSAVSVHERALFETIAVQLDGLPLALELAAARIANLGAAAVQARLGQQLPVLTGEPRDHRTMRGSIARSWAMLKSDRSRWVVLAE